ncbi:unnamed protein product, partial [Pleuronectes platessa]
MDVRNQRDPCCHVWMQQWLRSEKRRGVPRGPSLPYYFPKGIFNAARERAVRQQESE